MFLVAAVSSARSMRKNVTPRITGRAMAMQARNRSDMSMSPCAHTSAALSARQTTTAPSGRPHASGTWGVSLCSCGQRSGLSSERGIPKTFSYKIADLGPTPLIPLYCLTRLWYGTPRRAASGQVRPRRSSASFSVFMWASID